MLAAHTQPSLPLNHTQCCLARRHVVLRPISSWPRFVGLSLRLIRLTRISRVKQTHEAIRHGLMKLSKAATSLPLADIMTKGVNLPQWEMCTKGLLGKPRVFSASHWSPPGSQSWLRRGMIINCTYLLGRHSTIQVEPRHALGCVLE